MKDRRGIYLAAVIIMASLVYYGCGDSGNNVQTGNKIGSLETAENRSGFSISDGSTPAPVDRQVIFDDFKDISDNEMPEGVLGGTFFINRIYLAPGYKGQAGEIFYVSMEDGHIALLQEYQIVAGQDGKLKYEVVDTVDNQDKPSGDYEAYSLRKDEWVKVQ